MTPSFQEAPISQIPALRFLQQLGFSFLGSEEVAENGEPAEFVNFQIRACKSRSMCKLSLNRPATPLHDAHQGGCFMYGSFGKGGAW